MRIVQVTSLYTSGRLLSKRQIGISSTSLPCICRIENSRGYDASIADENRIFEVLGSEIYRGRAVGEQFEKVLARHFGRGELRPG
jgi:hypothetical protein